MTRSAVITKTLAIATAGAALLAGGTGVTLAKAPLARPLFILPQKLFPFPLSLRSMSKGACGTANFFFRGSKSALKQSEIKSSAGYSAAKAAELYNSS